MQCVPFRFVLFSVVGLSLAGCAHQPASHTSSSAGTTRTETTAAPASRPVPRRTGTNHPAPRTEASLPDQTGIAACDDYLSSYMACHRAAQIFAPDQLPARYQAMRTSLLRDSMDPDIRPQLAARCNSLATQLRQALHGKSCAVEPAAASSTP